MNTILFMPVCTKCLKIIWQTVDCDDKHNIVPDKCPYCGTWFDRIAMPTKLPFDARDYTEETI